MACRGCAYSHQTVPLLQRCLQGSSLILALHITSAINEHIVLLVCVSQHCPLIRRILLFHSRTPPQPLNDEICASLRRSRTIAWPLSSKILDSKLLAVTYQCDRTIAPLASGPRQYPSSETPRFNFELNLSPAVLSLNVQPSKRNGIPNPHWQ